MNRRPCGSERIMRTAEGKGAETFQIPGLEEIPVRVVKKRQKNCYLRVRNGEILITAPLRASKEYLASFAAKHEKWIRKQLDAEEKNGRAFLPEAPGEREALRSILGEYIRIWEPVLLVRSMGFRIRNMKSRWGSCNVRTGVQTFNLQLIHYDKECIEYVVVHELAHLRARGHDPVFWGIVEKALPDYKERKKRLQ